MRSLTKKKIFWPIIALMMVFAVNLILTPSFFMIEIKNGHLFGNVIDILHRGAPLIIISLGMTIVIATEGIDISVGSVVAIAGAMAAYLLIKGVNPFVIIIVVILTGAILGTWNGYLVSFIKIQPMVATLILMTVGRGIAQLITGGQILELDSKIFDFIGSGYILGIPFSVIMAILVTGALSLILRRTALGIFIESVGGNRESSEYAGVKSKQIVLLAYIICGIVTAIAAMIICSEIKAADANNAGLWMELDAILAVVIGGTSMNGGRFYIGGTIIGALFIQSLTTTIYSLGVPPEIILVVKSIVVIVVSLLQSEKFRDIIKARFSNAKQEVEI